MPAISTAGVLAVALALAACAGQSAATTAHRPPGPPGRTSAAQTPASTTRIASYPTRVGGYRLVNKADRPVAAPSRDHGFPQSFPFAATARDGYYLPGHQAHRDVYLIAGQLAPGALPAAAVAAYLGAFSGQEVHLTAEPAGPLGGVVKCWEAGGFTFCMWADRGTYGILDYRPPLGLDTVLIRHLAGLVPRFRQAMERMSR